jgi:hypothetical protein
VPAAYFENLIRRNTMADRCSASITIGGTLAEEHLAAFFAAIAAEDLAPDWDEAAFTPDDMVIGEQLTLCAHEVSWGSFNILEHFCRSHNLPYTRWNGVCDGVWGCTRSVYRGASEMGDDNDITKEYDVSEDDHILMGEQLTRHLGSFEAILDHFASANFTVPPLVIEAGLCR